MKQFLFSSVLLLSSGLFTSAGMLAAADAEHTAIKESLARIMPGETSYKISRAPVQGIYEVDFGDGFVYLSADGKYAIKGEIFDLQNNVNLTEEKRAAGRLATLAGIAPAEMLIYPADKQRTASITVFTDIDCGYCRRMHQTIKDYTSRGIEVKYVFYPRAGKNSESYKKAVSVWCADDQHVAMNKAKSGQQIATRNCKNPVDKHMDMANALGVTGTPTIILENGQRMPGYVKAEQLKNIIDNQSTARR